VARAQVGVRHGSITTIHCLTNTQSVLDAAWSAEKVSERASERLTERRARAG
jgi:glyceraldehyde-3-phosphate dehydrogenase/erythrose-4-phosphate dehydrogenase